MNAVGVIADPKEMLTFPLKIDWVAGKIGEPATTSFKKLTQNDFKEGAIEAVLDLATRVPPPLVWRLVLEPKSRPYTPRQIHVWQHLMNRIAPDSNNPGLEAIQGAFDRMESELWTKVQTGSELDLITLRDQMVVEKEAGVADSYFDLIRHRLYRSKDFKAQYDAFPRQDLSTKFEIMENIDDRQWQTLVNNKSTIWDQMFAKDMIPQTAAECDVYLEAVRNRDIDSNLKKMIQAEFSAMKAEIQRSLLSIDARLHVKRNDRCPMIDITRLRVMELHISALQIESELHDKLTPQAKDGALELKRIRIMLRHCAEVGFYEEEKNTVKSTTPVTKSRFPITSVLRETEIDAISINVWNHFATSTKHKSSTEILKAMFTEATWPITATECRFYGLAMQSNLQSPMNVTKHVVIALYKLHNIIIDNVKKSCTDSQTYDITKLDAMRARIELLETEDSSAKDELRTIKDAIARCYGRTITHMETKNQPPLKTSQTKVKIEPSSVGKPQTNLEIERFSLIFPLAKPLTKMEIERISLGEWNRAETLAQSKVNLLNDKGDTYRTESNRIIDEVMFMENAKPRTEVECDCFLDAIELKLGNESQLYFHVDYVQHKLAVEHNNVSDQTSLNMAIQRIKEFWAHDHEAMIESMWLKDRIEALRQPPQDEMQFPIRNVPTEQEIGDISRRAWLFVVNETKHEKNQNSILASIFEYKAIPITTFECDLYSLQIQSIFGLDVGSVLLNALAKKKR